MKMAAAEDVDVAIKTSNSAAHMLVSRADRASTVELCGFSVAAGAGDNRYNRPCACSGRRVLGAHNPNSQRGRVWALILIGWAQVI